MIAARPDRPVPVPVALRSHTTGAEVDTVWVNEIGGVTWELRAAGRHQFAKWQPAWAGIPLSVEADRLRWAGRHTPVPAVVESWDDADGSWLITEALPGRSAVDPRWTADPATAVREIGIGLRRLHDALPVRNCPYFWSVPDRLTAAGRPPGIGVPPPVDRLVVCHGDACAPNTLIGDDARWAGHVDLGALGVADRWADLAVAAWSTEWNYGPGWSDAVLAAYGVQPDPVRQEYYRRLWELT